MTEINETQPLDLPSCVHRVELDGRELFLVGTAHVSKQSVEDVLETLNQVNPDTVCVELCAARYQNIINQESWKNLNIFQVIKTGKAPLLLASLMMASFQKRIGEQLGVDPGAEMKAAIDWAQERDLEPSLVDRDIQVTLKRTWRGLGFFKKIQMSFQLFVAILAPEDIDEETIERIKEEEELSDMLSTMAQQFPEVKGSLIDERDIYLAEKIRRTKGTTAVAVVGAGHVPGMLDQFKREPREDLADIEAIPSGGQVGTLLKWGIPAMVIALLVYGFFKGGTSHSLESLGVWFLVNGLLSALGSLIAFGHPVTVVSAFLAAPLTSLNPMIAAGWVAGLVQAWIKKPTVGDLEDLPEAIKTVKGFWMNPTSRILLVVVLANLGSVLGTFIAGGWIAARTL